MTAPGAATCHAAGALGILQAGTQRHGNTA